MHWKKLTILIFLVVVALTAQTTPSQLTLTPVGVSTGCISSTNGDVLCAASDGFYISITGGAFQKIATGAAAQPTQITCTSATLSQTGLAASSCTFK